MTHLICALALLAPTAPAYQWIEAETPLRANIDAGGTVGGTPGLLSGGKWVTRAAVGGEPWPEGGVQLAYALEAPKPGTYAVWARIGFEWARSPFRWRLGGDAWQTVAPTVATTNVNRLATWTEAGWLKLTESAFSSSPVELEFNVTEPNGDRRLFALDCIALTPPTWTPDGVLQPGQKYDAPIDRLAERTVFPLPESPAGQTSVVDLRGAWRVARWEDPNPDAAPDQPDTELPKSGLTWRGIQVPGPAAQRDDLVFGHRLVYQANVDVPKSLAGRSFRMTFDATNWVVSVFVNGKRVGWRRSVLVPWELDVTEGVQPGKVNAFTVVVKGPWYAFDTSRGGTILQQRNLPNEQPFINYTRWIAPIYPSTKGEGDATQMGLIHSVRLEARGGVYVADAYAKPSVANGRLDADLTLRNPGRRARRVQLRVEAVDRKTGDLAKLIADKVKVEVPAGGETVTVVGAPWTDPKLWWPERDPAMYLLRTTTYEGGKPVDVDDTPFGFAEVTTDGIKLRINGVARNFWNWVAVSGNNTTPEEWLAAYERENNRFHRFSFDSETRVFAPSRVAQLDFMDRNGVPGRLSTCIDGMAITFELNNPKVWEGLSEHLSQVVRAYRNHPSVIVYSIENELLYINAQNLGYDMDKMEANVLAMVNEARKFDSRKPYMVDGGGALKSNALPIDCPHYPEARSDHYPDAAYTFSAYADHSSRWPWDRKRPMIIGESFFYAGALEDLAWIGGDRVFRGRDEANLAASKYTRLLVEGYRWQGVAGICPWVALDRIPGAELSFSDVLTVPRKRAYRLAAGQDNQIETRVFNDTLSAEPLTLAWTLSSGGQTLAAGSQTETIEPGFGKDVTLTLRPVIQGERADAVLRLETRQLGGKGSVNELPVSVLARPKPLDLAALVYDPAGVVDAPLARVGVRATRVDSLDALPDGGLLVVAHDSLTAEQAYGYDLLGFASRGGRVVVLEQSNPLAGSAWPAPVRSTNRMGGFAFAQAQGIELFRNLAPGDLEDWAGDHPTYKAAWTKPSGGVTSLIECGDKLGESALLEAQVGQGVILATQMRVGAKASTEPAAAHLLRNMIATALAFEPVGGRLATLSGEPKMAERLAPTALSQEVVPDLDAALRPGQSKVVLLEASPMNLSALDQRRDKVNAFTDAGGWVMLHGLTREGLEAFNRLVGYDHLLRPFRMERVTLDHPDSALAATIGNRDVALYGTQEIMFGDYFVSDRTYSHVVSLADAAPFAQMPDGPADPDAYTPTYSDNDPYNYVNGMLNSDSWRYIRQIGVDESGRGPDLRFMLRRPETVERIELWNNANYMTIEAMDILFDGDEATKVRVVLPPNGNRTPVELDPPRSVTGSITLRPVSARGKPVVNPDGSVTRLVGLDNVRILVRRPVPLALDNVGGLVAYPRGKGGLFLNQLDFEREDPNPRNQAKKLRLLSTLLRNMGVGVASSRVAIPGQNLVFQPVEFTRWANRRLKSAQNDQALFGDDMPLAHLAIGRQTLGEVEYLINDYVNAPVNSAIVLGGADGPVKDQPSEVRGVELNAKADVLYFLHTAQIHWNPNWDNPNPELWRYQVVYADGQSVEVPVRQGLAVGPYRSREPKSLPEASVAWSVPMPGWGADADRPVLYSMPWTNPRPDVTIQSLNLIKSGEPGRSTPALIALTLARFAR